MVRTTALLWSIVLWSAVLPGHCISVMQQQAYGIQDDGLQAGSSGQTASQVSTHASLLVNASCAANFQGVQQQIDWFESLADRVADKRSLAYRRAAELAPSWNQLVGNIIPGLEQQVEMRNLPSGQKYPCGHGLKSVQSEGKMNDNLSQLKTGLQAMLDAKVKELEWPGATVAVAFADGHSFQLSAGFEDVELRKPMPTDAQMLGGSTGKMFVSTIALQLVAEGKLGLDDLIGKHVGDETWFESLPNGSAIHVRNLMNHTSGLPRYIFQPKFLDSLTSDSGRTWTIEQRLELLNDQPAAHKVGDGWGYSDTNYIVLGAIIENICDQSFYELVQSRLIEPLELSATSPSVESHMPGLVQGYFGETNPFGLKGQSLVDGQYALNPQFEWCGGGFLTSSQDMARLAVAIHCGEVLTPSNRQQLCQAIDFRTGQQAETGYGLGTFVWQSELGLFYGHAGIMPGYLTQVELSQSHQFAVALQCNSDADMGRHHHSTVQQFSAMIVEQLEAQN